jgi:hypothetical protein
MVGHFPWRSEYLERNAEPQLGAWAGLAALGLGVPIPNKTDIFR